MTDQEFRQELAKYPNRIGFTAVNKIDWGRLTDAQFNTLLAKVPPEKQAEASRLKSIGYNTQEFSALDRDQFSLNVFDTLRRTYELDDPEGYYKYFYQEASVSAKWDEIAAVYNLLFSKPMALKPQLHYQKTVVGGVTTYTFVGGQAAADTWRRALTGLMVLGFKACPHRAGTTLDPTLVSAMLESRFVEEIATSASKASSNLKIFWRCDSRDRTFMIEGRKAEAQVDLVERAAELKLSQPWNPFSDPKIKAALWLRSSNRDNDYYSVVSVAVDFKTSVPFPTLDESKNPDYQFPTAGTTVKPFSQWTAADLSKHKKNLALVRVRQNGVLVDKIRLCTRTYGYMAVVNNGFVINTQQFGGGAFPERAVRGMAQDSMVAYLPFLRVHHGGGREDGFTMFPDSRQPAVLLLDKSEMVNRYNWRGADLIEKQFSDAKRLITGHEQFAWSSGGSQPAQMKLDVVTILERPLQVDVQPNDARLV